MRPQVTWRVDRDTNRETTMIDDFILSLSQGTTRSRAVLFDWPSSLFMKTFRDQAGSSTIHSKSEMRRAVLRRPRISHL